jgi:hypothetical protein
MTAEQVASAGFAPSRGDRLQRRCAVLAQLVATIALVVSLLVSGTAVSIGIARADCLPLVKVR